MYRRQTRRPNRRRRNRGQHRPRRPLARHRGAASPRFLRRYLARFRDVRQPRLRLRNRPDPRTRPALPQTWLTVNVREGDDRFAAGAGTAPYATRDIGGTRVGFFGVTTPETASINPNASELTFTDPIAAAERTVSRLRDEGVDIVVALSHLGRGDEALADAVDIDVILGGHVHSERVEQLNGTLVTRPGVNGHVLSKWPSTAGPNRP
nr:hypothetical protein [Haladaptatus sp. W1]